MKTGNDSTRQLPHDPVSALPSAAVSGSEAVRKTLTDFPPMKLPDDPNEALVRIASYLRTMDTSEHRAVKEGGEVMGYWQCPAWFDGLWDIASECDRIATPPNDKLRDAAT